MVDMRTFMKSGYGDGSMLRPLGVGGQPTGVPATGDSSRGLGGAPVGVAPARSWSRGLGGQPIGNSAAREARVAADDASKKARGSYGESIGSGVDSFTAEPMSWDAYNALAPNRRAAVDANTAFMNARTEDETQRTANPSAKGDDAYNKAVEHLFGKGGGSDSYAPKTVALATKFGLANSRGDLDNYVNGSALVTNADLAALTPDVEKGIGLANSATGDVVTGAPTERLANATMYSNRATRTLGQVLSKGQSLLDTINNVTPKLSNSGADSELDDMFDALARKGAGATFTPERVDLAANYFSGKYPGVNIQDYFENRLKGYAYSQADSPSKALLGNDPTGDYMSPEEFRSTYYATGGK